MLSSFVQLKFEILTGKIYSTRLSSSAWHNLKLVVFSKGFSETLRRKIIIMIYDLFSFSFG